MNTKTIDNMDSLIRSFADLLHDDYRQSECGRIILPFIILRRLDCLLEETEKTILGEIAAMPEGIDHEERRNILYAAANARGLIYNKSQFNLDSMKYMGSRYLKHDLVRYLLGFNSDVRDLLVDKLRLRDTIKDLHKMALLWNVYECICRMDLHPDQVGNLEMGHLLENLIHRFPEMLNETVGEPFVSREVLQIMVDLLLINDKESIMNNNSADVIGEIDIEDMT